MKREKKILKEEKAKFDVWHFIVFFSVSTFLFLRFFFDGLSYPYFNFCWNIYFFLLFVIETFRRRFEDCFYKEELFILLFFFISLISSSISTIKGSGVISNAQMLAYICFFSLIIRNLKGVDIKRLIYILLSSAFIINLFGIYQYFWGFEETKQMVLSNPELLKGLPPTFISRMDSRRVYATFVYPNIYASFLLFVIPTSFFLFFSEKSNKIKFFSLTIFLLSLYNLILTGSFGGILICLFILLIMILVLIIKDKRILRVVIISLLLLQTLTLSVLYTKGKLPKVASLTDRAGYWQAAIKTFKENPLLGVGPGNYMYRYTKFKRPTSMEAKHAHSIFFETLSETGLLGVISLFSFFTSFFLLFFKKNKKTFYLAGIGFSFLAFFLHNLIDFNFINPAVAILFFLGGGIGIVLSHKKPYLVDYRLTKPLNYLILIAIFLIGSIYVRYMLAEKNFAYSDKESFRNTKLVYLNRGIKLFPENFEAYERKGDIYFNDLIMSRNINFSEEAVRMYTKALTLNPYSSRIYRKLAVLYQEIEDFPMSEKMYLKMLDIYPVKKQYNLEATVFYMKQGNKEKAEYYYEKSSHFISATLEEERINDAYIKWIKSQK